MKKLCVFLVLFIAVNANAQWVKMWDGYNYPVKDFVALGTNIYEGTWDGVCKSTNNGLSWFIINNGLSEHFVYGLTVSGTKLFAGTYRGIFSSTNDGDNWNPSGLANQVVKVFAVSGTDIYAGNGGNVYISTNNGVDWTSISNGLPGYEINGLAVSGIYIFGVTDYGIYATSNNGASWYASGIPNSTVRSIAVSGTKVFVGTIDDGVFVSPNNGGYWSAVNNGLTSLYITSLAVSGSNIFVGTYNGIFLSTNYGSSWIQKNQGFNVPIFIHKILISNGYIYAGLSNKSIWRRSYSEIIGVQNITTETPFSYSLSQNYPNPFNPTTKIKFDIVKAGNVKIVVYDVTGREIQTLVNENLQPGTYETTFDGSGLTSGVYFYRILVRHGGSSADGYSETKKMIYLK